MTRRFERAVTHRRQASIWALPAALLLAAAGCREASPTIDVGATNAGATVVHGTATRLPSVIPKTSPAGTPAAGAEASDGTVTLEDPDGRFALRHAPLWRQVEPPPGDGTVTWLLRLERGQPDRPIPPGARRPPNGVRLDVGLVQPPPGVDLAGWAGSALTLDERSFSLTSDAFSLRVGPDSLPAVAREGQILPYFGRWREWLLPVPGAAGRAFVLRAASYGADEQRGMFHAKVVVATFRPYVMEPEAPRR